MVDRAEARAIMKRLNYIRTCVVNQYPFWGTLLLGLRFGVADCETAYTDMRHIVFDPQFANQLSDEEVMFVMMHEVMHCALQHCLRGKDYEPFIFNVACDIVVNSNLLLDMKKSSFKVAGEEAMHLAPDGNEGHLYTAEDVYEMLMAAANQGKNGKPSVVQIGNPGNGQGKDDGDGKDTGSEKTDKHGFDSHDQWKDIDNKNQVQDRWKDLVQNALRGGFAGEGSVINQLIDISGFENYTGKLNWREILQDFVQLSYDNYDYDFAPPDNRFCSSDFALPAFHELPEYIYKNLWFVVDTSGSISKTMLMEVYGEIQCALQTLPSLKGRISFFDTMITKPVEMEGKDCLKNIQPLGGGGTSFKAIFWYLQEHWQEIDQDMPVAIIILTDGEAPFPREEESLGIPVLWIINKTKVNPPWGKVVFM